MKEQLASCRQDGQSVIELFGRLSKLWEELDMYSPLPSCTCGAAPEIEKAREAEKMHQFVMGLDESRFGVICQSIVSSDSEMDIGKYMLRLCEKNNVLTRQRIESRSKTQLGLQPRLKWIRLLRVLVLLGQEDARSVLTAGEQDMTSRTVGNWLGFLIGGKSVRRLTEETLEQTEVAAEEVVVVGLLVLIARVTLELE